jgi:predicted phosphodiesterase
LRVDENELNQHFWIDSAAQSLNTRWKIMLGHHPLYSYGYHGSDETMQLLLEDILNENEIDVYLSGHDHDLQHLKANGFTEFFISGSAAKLRDTETGPLSLYSLSKYGFLSIRLSKYLMECYFIDKDGIVLYSFKKKKS